MASTELIRQTGDALSGWFMAVKTIIFTDENGRATGREEVIALADTRTGRYSVVSNRAHDMELVDNPDPGQATDEDRERTRRQIISGTQSITKGKERRVSDLRGVLDPLATVDRQDAYVLSSALYLHPAGYVVDVTLPGPQAKPQGQNTRNLYGQISVRRWTADGFEELPGQKWVLFGEAPLYGGGNATIFDSEENLRQKAFAALPAEARSAEVLSDADLLALHHDLAGNLGVVFARNAYEIDADVKPTPGPGREAPNPDLPPMVEIPSGVHLPKAVVDQLDRAYAAYWAHQRAVIAGAPSAGLKAYAGALRAAGNALASAKGIGPNPGKWVQLPRPVMNVPHLLPEEIPPYVTAAEAAAYCAIAARNSVDPDHERWVAQRDYFAQAKVLAHQPQPAVGSASPQLTRRDEQGRLVGKDSYGREVPVGKAPSIAVTDSGECYQYRNTPEGQKWVVVPRIGMRDDDGQNWIPGPNGSWELANEGTQPWMVIDPHGNAMQRMQDGSMAPVAPSPARYDKDQGWLSMVGGKWTPPPPAVDSEEPTETLGQQPPAGRDPETEILRPRSADDEPRTQVMPGRRGPQMPPRPGTFGPSGGSPGGPPGQPPTPPRGQQFSRAW